MGEKEEFTIKNYFDYLAEGKLMGSRCKKCSSLYIPPRKICEKCISDENMEWFEFSGKGTLATYSLIHVGARYFSNQGYSMKKPYCFGIVKLEEGPNISGHVVGIDESNPENFKIDMPLKAKFIKVEFDGQEPKIDLGFEPP
ncbi:MAG: Zn-ribbon domain-containing OB-fold protein [Promethearchaeota archaeon]